MGKLNKVFKAIKKGEFFSFIKRHIEYKKLAKFKGSDRDYIIKKGEITLGYKMDLDNPKTFNEKINWLKLNDQKEIYTTMADKYNAKFYISKIVGQDYIIPTLGVWDHFDDIDFDSLPNQFVLKTTHDSGGVVVVKDKTEFNYKQAKKKLENSLKRDFSKLGREYQYKNVPRKIIAEEYLFEPNDVGAIDNFKFYCSNGEPFIFYISKGGGHTQNMTMTYFDMNKKRLDLINSIYSPEPADYNFSFPKDFDKMVEIARKLSSGNKFLRVDFYYVNNHIYVGEMTFHPGSGFEGLSTYESDLYLGSFIKLN